MIPADASIAKTPPASKMGIKSIAFEPNAHIPPQYTCDGSDWNPPLEFFCVPERSESLALIVEDPDAPAGLWTHWVVFNILPSTKNVEEGKEPEGVPGVGTAGNFSYRGPCPPSGVHRYFFRLYALDAMLDLRRGSTREELMEAMRGHILAEAALIGLCARTAR